MSVKTVTLDDAAGRLPELVTRASEGEQIVIARNERPLAKLVPCSQDEDDRIFGQARGRVHVSRDFDEPLPDGFWLGRSSSEAASGYPRLPLACRHT